MRQFIYHACNGTLGYHSLRYASVIDLMHNDVKQCFRGANVHCGIFSFTVLPRDKLITRRAKELAECVSFNEVSLCRGTSVIDIFYCY